MKPIISQLTTEPPVALEDHPNLPSMQEVDDLVVNCVGQMAIAAESDLLWKPLNTEVLLIINSIKLPSFSPLNCVFILEKSDGRTISRACLF